MINGTSNTFLGIGMPNTALLSQSLLGTLSLPVVLILSTYWYEGTSQKYWGDADFGGNTPSSLHSIINKPVVGSATGNPIYWYSTAFFALGNVGLGVERVLKILCLKISKFTSNENVYVDNVHPVYFASIFPPNSALEDIWGCCI